MPNRPADVNEAMRRWTLAALKAGANSPRKVQEWIGQNASIEAPSIPTIANIMKEEGYKPAGFVWEKKSK